MKSLPIELTIIAFLLCLVSCQTANEQNDIIKTAKDYQSVIDLKIEEIIALQGQIRQQITESNRAGQDTFQLAKNLVPLKTAKFLLETQHDKITTNIKALEKRAIQEDSLTAVIEQSQAKVEEILKGNQIWE